MFWQIMKPKGGGEPSGPIAEAIIKTFGHFKDFQTKFNEAGVKQFGSGWVWLAGNAKGEVRSSPLPTRTIPSARASIRFSATTCGSTPTTSSTTIAGRNTCKLGGM